MKRLLITLITVFSLIGLSSTAFAAARFWKVTISSPANTTSKTFNVQYTTSSTDETDDITVELIQNGSTSIGSQTTTAPGGDSGVFQVTVPSVGTYSYFIRAANSNVAEPKNTGTVNVTVSDPPASTVTTVFVNSGTNTATTGNAVGGQGGGAAAGGGAVAQADGGGGNAGGAAGQTGAAGGGPTGQVGDQTATTETANDGDVLGSETTAEEKKDDKKTSTTNPLWYVLGLGALSAIGYGAYTMRNRAVTKE